MGPYYLAMNKLYYTMLLSFSLSLCQAQTKNLFELSATTGSQIWTTANQKNLGEIYSWRYFAYSGVEADEPTVLLRFNMNSSNSLVAWGLAETTCCCE